MNGNKQTLDEKQEKTRILIETGVFNFKSRLILTLEGLSGNAFAKKVGMSEAVIRDYLSGKTYPSLNRLAIIAQKCQVPIEWLATGKGDCRLATDMKPTQTINIPFYDLREIHFSEANHRSIPFDMNWIKRRGFDQKSLIAISAKGDSMEPTISNHDILIINKTDCKPLDGYLYVIQYHDQLSIKRIQNQGSQLALLCDNSKYPTIVIDKNDTENFEIMGHAVYVLKDLY